MNLLRVDHTAMAVRDLDEALATFRRLYNLEPTERRVVTEQRVEVVFLAIGDTKLELIQPIDTESGVARFLEQRGEGLHHVGVLVEDLGRELTELAAAGAELLDREPRQGVHGLIAFVRPSSTHGVLVELVERRSDEELQG